QMVSRAKGAGLGLTVQQVFERPTLGELARAANTTRVEAGEQGLVTGRVAWTPIQRWFLEGCEVDRHHFNQALLLEVRERIEAAWVQAALGALLSQHDALRLRWVRGESGALEQTMGGPEAPSFEPVDLSALADDDARRRALEAACDGAQRSLDLERGPLVRGVLFELGPGRAQRLFVVAHHIAVDGVSWRVLLEDLWRGVE